MNPLAFLETEVASMVAAGTLRWPRTFDSAQVPRARVDGREVINLCSNNYLGLAYHPRLRAAATAAIDRWGVGSGAARPIAGSLPLHGELERELARFKRVEAVLTYPSGFAVNAGTVAALLTKDDVVVSDELNHASIIDGCRLSGAEKKIYRHRDVGHCRALLAESRGARARLLVTDGVFSMDGDIAPLPALCEAAREHDAIMMVDDAHASGVLGRDGRGTVDHFGLHGAVHIQVGTLSKAFAGVGGFVAGSEALIRYLMNRSRPILFSTSLPPAVVASCLEVIRCLEEDPSLLTRLWSNTRSFKARLRSAGFDTGASETPITPIMIGDEDTAVRFSNELFNAGVFGLAIGFPTVPRGKARIRTIVTSAHTEDDLSEAADIIARVGRYFGLLSKDGDRP
ncbi:MAG: glycine C-acetyltransferase [Armatimonadetes bacterium]|nr:glycine C-acetyltransferase [Armatimonadota bacterium]